MRTLILIFVIILSPLSIVNSQEIIYPEIEKELNEEQRTQFDNAIKFLQKASGNENTADAIDYKYRKKRNSPKWELKTWEAKEQRIIAERNYQQAYAMISAVYTELINNSEYETIQDKTKAHSLNTEAEEQFKAAGEILSKFQDLSKISMANTNYEMLQTELKKSHELKITGIQDQITALKINREKVDLRIDEQDLAAWEKAISENTVASYHEYLNNNPRGKYASKANKRIRMLETSTKDIAENKKISSKNNPKRNLKANNNTSTDNKNTSTETDNANNDLNKANHNNYSTNKNEELVFKVQIAASKTALTDWILMHKAPDAKLIEEYRTSSWIKYMVGSFKTYHDAASYRNKLKSTSPDAFIVVFEKGKQVAVTEQMKM